MKSEYIVTYEYLAQKGLDLNDYLVEDTLVAAIIGLGLDLCITRICKLNDSFKGEKSVEEALDEKPDLLDAFYKLQYRMIYNLIFQNETNPADQMLDDVIVFELGWGKINGFQKGIFYKER